MKTVRTMAVIFILSVTFILLCSSCAIAENSGTCGENLTWNLDENGTLTISGSGDMIDFEHVSAAPWNSVKNQIKTVELSEGVTSIGKYAFYYCTNLTTINIPESLNKKNEWAILACISLSDVNVAASNPFFMSQDGILFNKSKTELVLYPTGRSETSYIVPDGVTVIGEFAFSMSPLTSIVLPESVVKFGSHAFDQCRQLEYVSWPTGLEAIGDDSFYWCTSLKNVSFGNSLTHIGDGAFVSCLRITELKLPDSLLSIDENAFLDCEGITSVEIPANVESIGDNVFGACSRLLQISVSNKNQHFTTIDGALYSQDKKKLLAYPAGRTNEAFTVPSDVTHIPAYAFSSCENLTRIYIHKGVQEIYKDAFTGCSKLTDVYYAGSEDEWNTILIQKAGYYNVLNYVTMHYNAQIMADISGILRSGDGWRIVWSVENGIQTDGITPYTSLVIELVGNSSDSELWAYSDSNDSDDFPWLTRDYNYTKDSFTHVTIEGTSSTSLYIIPNMFEAYSNLTNVTLSYISGMGNHAFANCPALKSVNGIDDSTVSIGEGVFKNDSKLTEITWSRAQNDGTVTTKEPASLATIGKEAFMNTAISSFYFTQGALNNIGADAFTGCSIEGIVVADGVTTIPDTLFSDWRELQSIRIPASVTSIGENTFNGCSLLTIWCEKDSYAHTYAVNHEIPYRFYNISTEAFVMGKDNWSFSNEDKNFGTEGYYLSSSDFAKLTQSLSPQYKSLIEKRLKYHWGGSCYGMSATAVLVKLGVVSPGAIQSGKANLYDIRKYDNDNVESFINFYHMQQFLPAAQREQSRMLNSSKRTQIDRVIAKGNEANETGKPFILGFHFTNGGGHAVVGYGVETGTYYVNDNVYDTKILIYDCSNPASDSGMYCNTHNTNVYISKWGSGISNFCLATNSTSLFSSTPSGNENDGFYPQLIVPLNNTIQIQYQGNTETIDKNSINGGAGLISTHELSGTPSSYTVNFINGESDVILMPDTGANLIYDSSNCLYDISAQSAEEISLPSDGGFGIKGSSGSYQVEMTTNNTDESIPWHSTIISGQSQDFEMSRSSQGLFISGEHLTDLMIQIVDEEYNSTLVIDNDYGIVLVTCQADDQGEKMPVVLMDADGDGVFETDISDGGKDTTTLPITSETIPDENFRQYIKENFDINGDSALGEEEIKNVISIDVSGCNITSLTGLEHFTYLEHLLCGENMITSIDVTKNINLRELFCGYGHNGTKLTELDVSKCTKLTHLYCAYTDIVNLDLSNNQELIYLFCESNKLSTLNLSNNPNLERLLCSWNELTELDISNNPKLYWLECEKNNITTLDISHCSKLVYLINHDELGRTGTWAIYPEDNNDYPDYYLSIDSDVKLIYPNSSDSEFLGYGMITNGGTNMRSGPSKSYRSICKLDRYTIVRITGTLEDDFYPVSCKSPYAKETISGYIHYDYVRPLSAEDILDKCLSMPTLLKVIEEDAFSGVSGIFAVGIPATVNSIADTAFPEKSILIIADEDSYAYSWALENGYLVDSHLQ